MDVGQAADYQVTCRHNDSSFVGGHVGRRGAILLIYVAIIVHGVGFASAHQLVAFADTAVHWRLPGVRGNRSKEAIIMETCHSNLNRIGQSLRHPWDDDDNDNELLVPLSMQSPA